MSAGDAVVTRADVLKIARERQAYLWIGHQHLNSLPAWDRFCNSAPLAELREAFTHLVGMDELDEREHPPERSIVSNNNRASAPRPIPFESSTSELTRFSTVPALPHQFTVLLRALAHTRSLGLALPKDIEFSFRAAPQTVTRGTAEHDLRTQMFRILLRDDVYGDALARLAFHELKHISDQFTNRWDQFDKREREERAEDFADRALASFPREDW